jgi:NTP pyrophosphatase (non-canonical NTP hydrolase)
LKLKPELTMDILSRISSERNRQDEKWGLQRHSPERWLTIAVEEIGEMAQAIQKGDIAHKEGSDADDLLTETIQAAAVLVSFAEQLVEEEENKNGR